MGVDTGGAHEAKESIAGDFSPERNGADRTGNRSYKGGKEVAPWPERDGSAGQQLGGTKLPLFELSGPDLQGSSAKAGEEGIHFSSQEHLGLDGLSSSAADVEMTACETQDAVKKGDAELPGEVRTLGCVGQVLLQKILEVSLLRSQTTGRSESKALFPLPTSRRVYLELEPDLGEDCLNWTSALCLSLNSLWGMQPAGDVPLNDCQRNCLKELIFNCRRFCGITEPLDDVTWEDFFRVRTVDYCGEEVKVGQWFSWSNIFPALPAHVGSVPLEDVCSLGCT